MTVYHGTTLIVEKPSVEYSKRHLDFGVGFYVTADKKQAESWAKRKAVRLSASPIVNAYTLSNKLAVHRGLIFENDDGEWLDFVAKCRTGNEIYKEYDYVSGSVANDDVFVTVDMDIRGIWDKDRALTEIRYYKTSHQICLINQVLIDRELIFDKSYEVE